VATHVHTLRDDDVMRIHFDIWFIFTGIKWWYSICCLSFFLQPTVGVVYIHHIMCVFMAHNDIRIPKWSPFSFIHLWMWMHVNGRWWKAVDMYISIPTKARKICERKQNSFEWNEVTLSYFSWRKWWRKDRNTLDALAFPLKNTRMLTFLHWYWFNWFHACICITYIKSTA